MASRVSPPRRRVVAVDFDGVLAGPSGVPLPGAVSWLEGLCRRFEPVIFSCRARSGSGRVWLEEWCVREAKLALRATVEKPDAAWFVDDRAWNPVREGGLPSVDDLADH